MKIMFVSLGCDKNLVDTENMMGILQRSSYEFTDDESEADVIIVNSCCFIGPAKEESIDTILEMAKQKDVGNCKALIVTGCLAQRYREEILSEMPEVDAVVGTTAYDSIAKTVDAVMNEAVGEMVTDKGMPGKDIKTISRRISRILSFAIWTGFLRLRGKEYLLPEGISRI